MKKILKLSSYGLIISLIVILIITYYLAKITSDTYDFKKSCIYYLPCSIIIAIIQLIIGMDIFIIIGYFLFGYIMLMFFSNYFFYK